MPRSRELTSQRELKERTERLDRELREHIDVLEKSANEVDAIDELLAKLEFAGTAEGADAVEESVVRAEDSSERAFSEEEVEYEEAESESQEFQEELEIKESASERDGERLTETTQHIENTEVSRELREAEKAILNEITVLKEIAERALADAEHRNRIVGNLQSRVRKE